MKTVKKELSPAQKVALARHPQRPNGADYIETLFTDFFAQCGDRLAGEDESILGGVALFDGKPVTVIATQKGKNLEENLRFNFGMPSPTGYRKIQRLVRSAEKFNRPIITFIDTPGAYPGKEAEEGGQGEAIASCLALFSQLSVPVIAIITGEGGSGGALALGVANKVAMLEHSIYSVLSPEGFATILWKDASRKDEAARVMKLTAQDLKGFGIIDAIIAEGEQGAHLNKAQTMEQTHDYIKKELGRLEKQSPKKLKESRYKKFRAMGGPY